ncbi:MAG: amidohydrolase [Planctomycetes bacterium]|nr:amidohydrolase [Planctomycetota bacterium]
MKPAFGAAICSVGLFISSCAVYFGGNEVTSIPAPATFVVRNANIYDPVDGRVGTALAVRDGKIVIIGSDADVQSLIQPRTHVLNADGGVVLPGLHDAHGHLLNLGFELERADLRGAKSEAEMVARAAEFAKKHADGWLLGRAWDQNLWIHKQFPTHSALDAATGARPAFLVRVDGHAGLANAAAMKLAGVGRSTQDPPGGRIIKDESGEPTGVFIDDAMGLVARAIPAPGRADRTRGYLNAQKESLAAGLVCVHDAGLGIADQEVLEELDREHKLKLRIYGMALADAAPAAARAGDRYELRAVKAYADGALGSRGAAMLEPYSDDPANRGLLLIESGDFIKLATACADRGLQLCTHAIGDRGNRLVLDAYETVFKQKFGTVSRPDLRWRVEHCQVVAPADFARFKQLGLIASMQPTHATSDGPWAPARIGNQRMEGAYAWGKFIELNIPLAFGSDFPVESHDPRLGIYAALTLRDPGSNDNKRFGPGRTLTMKETIAAFTTGAAFAAFHENDWGRLKKDFVADLTIFDKNFVDDSDPRAVLNAKVIRTIVGGEVAYPAP